MVSFTQENIDFADDKLHDDLQDAVNAELAGVLQNESKDVETILVELSI